MKCQHCGSELDRLSKWRGSSEFCSEECKKLNQDEFNRLAMSRLMQPRPARTNARHSAAAVRTMESPAGPLTVVTHPVGASSPIVTEPPEAGFIMEASATLSELQLRHQPHLSPPPQLPQIPLAELPVGDSLLALQAILAGLRPALRSSRRLPPAQKRLALPANAPPLLVLPAGDPVWPAALGLTFRVEGFDSPSQATGATSISAPEDDAPVSASAPVAHRPIPSLRSKRQLAPVVDFAIGTDRAVQLPSIAAPRLRIHLPKPLLNPFRPRYAFAPPPPVEPASKARPAAPAAAPSATVAPLKVVEKQPTPLSPTPALPPESTKDRPKLESKKADARKTEKPPVERAEGKVAPKAPEPVAETYAVPSFGGTTDAAPEGFFSRIPGWAKAFAALAVIGAGVGLWLVPEFNRGTARAASISSPASAPATMGPESWETDSAGDTSGIARRRVISQYKPARGKRDYIFEFSGQVEQRAMGWIFRMKDARNYYCLKLEQSGGSGAQLVKFAVVNGDEQPHRLVELRDPLPSGAPVKIRLDVRGQNFSTQVNGRPVDVWIDNQIPDGTVGFSNESGERAVIRSVKVTY